MLSASSFILIPLLGKGVMLQDTLIVLRMRSVYLRPLVIAIIIIKIARLVALFKSKQSILLMNSNFDMAS